MCGESSHKTELPIRNYGHRIAPATVSTLKMRPTTKQRMSNSYCSSPTSLSGQRVAFDFKYIIVAEAYQYSLVRLFRFLMTIFVLILVFLKSIRYRPN